MHLVVSAVVNEVKMDIMLTCCILGWLSIYDLKKKQVPVICCILIGSCHLYQVLFVKESTTIIKYIIIFLLISFFYGLSRITNNSIGQGDILVFASCFLTQTITEIFLLIYISFSISFFGAIALFIRKKSEELAFVPCIFFAYSI